MSEIRESARMQQTSITTNAARETGQNIIREEGSLSIEFRKQSGEYFVHEKGAGVCTFATLAGAVEYFNERAEAATNASAATTAPQVMPQMFGNREVRILKSKSTGQRAAEIRPFGRIALRFFVPLEMLSLAAGKDEWMREIEFKCADCGEKHAAKDMECEMCPTCFEKAGEENAAMDRGE